MSAVQTQARLTAKGAATRAKIVQTAAELIYRKGAQHTSVDDIRRAAGVSGSQIDHYFADKEDLIRAVLAWRADDVVQFSSAPRFDNLDSLEGIRAWADSYIASDDSCEAGCSYGSLASELIKSGIDIRDDVAADFDRWEGVFRRGIEAMQRRGELDRAADPASLAQALMAAFQGGMLLSVAARSTRPLKSALDSAIAYIEAHATDRTI